MAKRPDCPNCAQRDEVVPIVYGEPPYESFQAQEHGELQLGGCLPDSSTHFCRRCELSFAPIRQPLKVSANDEAR